jgi:hypothetical protein
MQTMLPCRVSQVRVSFKVMQVPLAMLSVWHCCWALTKPLCAEAFQASCHISSRPPTCVFVCLPEPADAGSDHGVPRRHCAIDSTSYVAGGNDASSARKSSGTC